MNRRVWVSLGIIIGMLVGLPVVRAQVNNAGLTFARLAEPPGGTALGSSGAPFSGLAVQDLAVNPGFSDALISAIGIAPSRSLRVSQDDGSGNGGVIVLEGTTANVWGTSAILSLMAGGTIAAPTATTNNTGLLEIWAFGFDGTAFVSAGNIFVNQVGAAGSGVIAGNVQLQVFDLLGNDHNVFLNPDGTLTGELFQPDALNVIGAGVFGGTVTATDFIPTTTRAAHLVYVGPASGSAAVPTWRALVAGDIPDLSGTYLTSVVSAPKWTTARNLAGNSVDGSAAVAFANKVIVQGTTDAGLSAAQFLGALGTGLVKNTTTTGVLSIAAAGDIPDLSATYSPVAGNASLVTVGTIGTGVWSGTAIVDGKIASALTGKTYNGLTLTSTTGTFTLAAGKTFTVNNTITLTGTDAQTYTFPTTSATLARTDAANTFTGHQTIEGVTSTGATGTGKLVFDGTPTLVTPAIGAATGTSLVLSANLQIAAGSSTSAALQFGSTAIGFAIFGSHIFSTLPTGNGPAFGTNSLGMPQNGVIGWTGSNDPTTTKTTFISQAAAATVQFGQDVNGAAVSQTLTSANGITGTDKTGGNFTFASGKGTGAGAVSSIFLQTPTALGSGTTAQSLTTRVTIDVNGIKATGYNSSDGTAGLTATCTLLSITTFTVKNGLITACS